LLIYTKKNNLKVFDVEEIDSQGGSIRCYICKKKYSKNITKKTISILLKEKNIGLTSSSKLKNFKFKITNHIRKMKIMIEKLKKRNKKIFYLRCFWERTGFDAIL